MKISSVNIGVRKEIQWKNSLVTTGIFKYPVKEAISLGLENVANDAVVDRIYHGGFDKAVYAYGENHYAHWQKLYPNLEFNFGMFGENLTISRLCEDQIFVGDTFEVGSAIIEVTKPREPCYKLGVRFGDAKVIKQFWNDNKCGVYFKVLQIGQVRVGDALKLVKHHAGNLTIAQVYQNIKNKLQ